MEFKVHRFDLLKFNSINLNKLSTEAASSFIDKYSRIYGQGLQHNYDYIIGRTDNFSSEHYFNSNIFNLLKFK